MAGSHEFRIPTLEEIVDINEQTGEGGVLISRSNLEFILNKVELERSMAEKAASILIGIIKLHPFLDGNKRTAFSSMVAFLEFNGKKFKYSRQDVSKVEKTLVRIAKGIQTDEKTLKWIEGGTYDQERIQGNSRKEHEEIR